MSSEELCNVALNLLRRMPINLTTKTLSAIHSVQPDIMDDLLPDVDEPLRIYRDGATGKDYVICDYNRDGEAYRSPHSNKYFLADGTQDRDSDFFPSDQHRQLEIEANSLFDNYRDQYFQGGYSSVYFFECEQGFGAVWLVHKDVPAVESLSAGWWDSVHIFDVQPTGKPDEFNYTLTSTVLISMQLDAAGTGSVDLSGSLANQVSRAKTIGKFKGHIQNMGPMLEDQESLLRNRIEDIYIQKTRQVLAVRSSTGQRDDVWATIAQSLKERPKADQ